MLLTFAIPTYNRAQLVARAIDSVLNQRLRFGHPFEVIVIDDGSSDDSPQVLSRYDSVPEVRLIRFPQNRGLGAARNEGFAQARGEWCALLDSDNKLLP